MNEIQVETCPVCHAEMTAQNHWLIKCPQCRFLKSHLEPGTGAPVQGVKDLRRQNFETILDDITKFCPAENVKVLEIGCARGWFLDAAVQRGYRVVGIEPDSTLAETAQLKGHDVRAGFFPECLNPDETFDIIIFNDVFEHLPDPNETIRLCHTALADGGHLIINLPDSDGIFYNVARALNCIGIRYPLERLWQMGLSSPHLSYFNIHNLTQMVTRHGFNPIHQTHLKTVTLQGLWTRLNADNALPTLLKLPIWIGVAATLPALWLLPKDISVCFFQKKN